MRHLLLLAVGTALTMSAVDGRATSTRSLETTMTTTPTSAPDFSDVTPNLFVTDMARSVRFYQDVLGFELGETVPGEPPFVFAWLKRGGVNVFLNSLETAKEDYPALAARPVGGTCTLFIVMSGVDAYHERVRSATKVTMPIKTQFYGMREFAIEDPDGYVLTFAERVAE